MGDEELKLHGLILAAGCAIDKVRVSDWVPIELDFGGEELFEETKEASLASLFGVGEGVVGGPIV